MNLGDLSIVIIVNIQYYISVRQHLALKNQGPITTPRTPKTENFERTRRVGAPRYPVRFWAPCSGQDRVDTKKAVSAEKCPFSFTTIVSISRWRSLVLGIHVVYRQRPPDRVSTARIFTFAPSSLHLRPTEMPESSSPPEFAAGSSLHLLDRANERTFHNK